MDAISRIDHWLFRNINSKLKKPYMDSFMMLMTVLGSPTVTAAICVICLLNRRTAAFGKEILIATLISQMLVQLCKRYISRVRPYLAWDNVNLRAGFLMWDYSFPSGHTTASSAILTILASYFPFLLFPSVVLGLLIGISRVYLGQHYPSDVVMGGFCGVLTALIVIR